MRPKIRDRRNLTSPSTLPPGGHRTNQIGGDIVINGQVPKDFGLHLIDVNLAMGNLLDVIGDQTKTYLKKH